MQKWNEDIMMEMQVNTNRVNPFSFFLMWLMKHNHDND